MGCVSMTVGFEIKERSGEVPQVAGPLSLTPSFKLGLVVRCVFVFALEN